MFHIPSADWRGASPRLRDEFLNALEANDHVGLRTAATVLQRCSNPLPSVICQQLGLRADCTYGDGAAAVILRLDGAATEAPGGIAPPAHAIAQSPAPEG